MDRTTCPTPVQFFKLPGAPGVVNNSSEKVMRPKSSEDSDLLTLNCLSQFNFYSTHGFLIQWLTCEIKPDSSVEGVSAGVSPPPACSCRRELGADLPTSASRSMTRPPPRQAPTRTRLLLGALAPNPHASPPADCLKQCFTDTALCRLPHQVKGPPFFTPE